MASPDSIAAELNLTDVERDEALQRLRRFAMLMDSSVSLPGTSFTLGLESLLGFVPVVGDFAGGVLSCYVPFEAWRLGAPASLIARMIGNILLETVVGTVPVIGDAFDAAYKSNVRNVRMLERYLEGT